MALFLLFLAIDSFWWFWMGSLHKNIQLMLELLRGQVLALDFPYHTLMTFLINPDEVIVSATRRRRDIKILLSVGPRSETFNIVSNNHGRMQKFDFCVSVCKTNFYRPAWWSILYTVFEIHFQSVKCKAVWHTKISSTSIPSHQHKQCKRLQGVD